MIVALAIFMVIITAVVSLFISIILEQRQILQKEKTVNEMNYALSYMSKALRVAAQDKTNSYNCLGTTAPIVNNTYLLTYPFTVNSTTQYYGIKFINQSDTPASCEEFFYNPTTLQVEEDENGGSAVALTSTSLQINYMKIVVTNQLQPRVTIVMSATVDNENIIMQNTISERALSN